jgi:hypothetical protein
MKEMGIRIALGARDVEQHRAPAATLHRRHAERGEDLDSFEEDDVRHAAEGNARPLDAASGDEASRGQMRAAGLTA